MLLFMRSISILPLQTRVRLSCSPDLATDTDVSLHTVRTLGWSSQSRAPGIQLFRQWIIKNTPSLDRSYLRPNAHERRGEKAAGGFPRCGLR